jgi:hypothetical protein
MNRQLMIVLLTSLVVACASQPAKPPPATVTAPPAAPSSAAVPASSNAAADSTAAASAPAGTATVIFYRPSKFIGGAVGFIVREGTTELGKLRSGKFFVLHVAPGKHTYVVHSEASDELTIDTDAGETYYIEGEIGIGVVVGRPHIKPSDQTSFEAIKGKLEEVPPMAG